MLSLKLFSEDKVDRLLTPGIVFDQICTMVGLGPKDPPSRKGSMHDVPKDLMDQIKILEDLFSVDTQKLNFITERFTKELAKGLSKEGGSIPMNPTWVLSNPTGHETGTYLALDMGGTNLRVCEIELPEEPGKFDIMQSKYRMPSAIKTGTAEDLFDYVADCLKQFLISNHEDQNMKEMSLGFTFSYPCTQEFIDHGVLQRWTKGFDVQGVEGKDVVPLFEAALAKKGVPIKVTALINDTTGTLVASNYTDQTTKIGCIFGTGCNAAYFELAGSIPKLEHMNLPPDMPIAINCEWGAFDNEHYVLPRTVYDAQIDEQSPRPGQQAFEKMIAGYYLGEILRLTLLDLAERRDVEIFAGQKLAALQKPYSLDASFLAEIESDPWENLGETEILFEKRLGIQTTEPERKLIRRLAELIGTRAARLSACGIAAIVRKRDLSPCSVGADGSVFNKYPHFKERNAAALREILGHDDVIVKPAEDGSGVGAALIAALTNQRIKDGILAGISKVE
ncbi:hexokinase A, variant 2 [Orbilia oligospora]|uniref:Phosphotransferase n=2 Tax=Orbilia oligospora TaxID=2813651 RepID=A0A7C8K2F1_ORBOL|nr:hexokinase A, variant 2 [Orbilia oligospora]TGJ66538.1 hexokinase A, variant 2 [Orbilia oligospora]